MYYEFSSQIMRNNITKNAFHHSTILEDMHAHVYHRITTLNCIRAERSLLTLSLQRMSLITHIQ